jgi:hypothetical protein
MITWCRKRRKKKVLGTKFPGKMAKEVQVLSNSNENLFGFFFGVKKFCGSSLAQAEGVCCSRRVTAPGV